jgi:hypothetical protein
VIPRALVADDPLPRFQSDSDEHQEIKHSQQVNVYRADAFVFFTVRRENVFDKSHTTVYVRNDEEVAVMKQKILVLMKRTESRKFIAVVLFELRNFLFRAVERS